MEVTPEELAYEGAQREQRIDALQAQAECSIAAGDREAADKAIAAAENELQAWRERLAEVQLVIKEYQQARKGTVQ